MVAAGFFMALPPGICYYQETRTERRLSGQFIKPGGSMKKTMLACSLLVLSGCSLFSSNNPPPLIETEPINVRDCRKIGTFPGPVGKRMWGPPAVLADFKTKASLKAKEMGATHIYWRQEFSGLDEMIVGHAYDCTGVDTKTGEE